MGFLIKLALDGFIAGEKAHLFMNLTVGELLWGFNNTFLIELKKYASWATEDLKKLNPFLALKVCIIKGPCKLQFFHMDN